MISHSKISLFFPDRHLLEDKKITVLGGDVGGTKVNLAVFEATSGEVKMIKCSTYHSSSASSLNNILKQFLEENPDLHPEIISLGVAGPVFEGRVNVTNLPWLVDSNEISTATGVTKVTLLNDLEATAYGIQGMDEKDIYTLHHGDVDAGGNISILSPGTGLGEAGLFWDGKFHHPFATEGGHCDYSCRSATDLEMHDFLLRKYKVVSWESVIAGPAIHSIYEFLCEIKKIPVNPAIADKIKTEDASAVISEAAMEGTDRACIETMRVYIRNLARECCNLILK